MSARLFGERLSVLYFEPSPGDQYVQFYVDQTDRVTAPGPVHRRIAEVRRIDDRDATAADDLEIISRTNERSGVLVQTDTDRERIVGQRRQQPAQPVPLPKMLVDDEAVGQPQAWRHRDHVRARGAAFVPAGNHVFRHEGRTRRRTGDMHTGGISPAYGLRNRCAAEGRGEPQLVAACHEHPVRLADVVAVSAVLAVLTRFDLQNLRMLHANLAKQLFVIAAGIFQFGGGRDDAMRASLPPQMSMNGRGSPGCGISPPRRRSE